MIHKDRGRTSTDIYHDKNRSTSGRLNGESQNEFEDRCKLQSRISRIRHKVVVLSGKGGAGKSTLAVNAAASLVLSGKRVGLLDVDLHGSSIPTMLGLERESVCESAEGLLPIDQGGLKVMAMGFLRRDRNSAVILPGPMKMNVIKRFFKDVIWGDLDFLIIDCPPGTGDELLSVCQLIGLLSGAVIVTTPQKVAAVNVRKTISFCRELDVPVLGVVENMSGFVCPECGTVTRMLSSGGGQRAARCVRAPFWGSIPIDPRIVESCDAGQAFIRHYAASSTAEIMRRIFHPIAALDDAKGADGAAESAEEKGRLRNDGRPACKPKAAVYAAGLVTGFPPGG